MGFQQNGKNILDDIMEMFWENRCLVCDHIWESNSCTEPCSECGEENDIFAEEVSEERYVELLKEK